MRKTYLNSKEKVLNNIFPVRIPSDFIFSLQIKLGL